MQIRTIKIRLFINFILLEFLDSSKLKKYEVIDVILLGANRGKKVQVAILSAYFT